jgi:hypothetical protein
VSHFGQSLIAVPDSEHVTFHPPTRPRAGPPLVAGRNLLESCTVSLRGLPLWLRDEDERGQRRQSEG